MDAEIMLIGKRKARCCDSLEYDEVSTVQQLGNETIPNPVLDIRKKRFWSFPAAPVRTGIINSS